MYKLIVQGTGEVLFQTKSKKLLLSKLPHFKNTTNFNGEIMPLQIIKGEELLAEIDSGYSFNSLIKKGCE